MTTIDDIQRLAATQLSLPSRLGHSLLLVVSLTVAAGVASLWATEPALPARVHAGFAAIVGIALAWAAFAAWVLARRRVLFGADRVLASGMATLFTAAGALGFAAIGFAGYGGRAAFVGAGVHSALCVLSGVLFRRARRHVAALRQRQRELETELAHGR